MLAIAIAQATVVIWVMTGMSFPSSSLTIQIISSLHRDTDSLPLYVILQSHSTPRIQQGLDNVSTVLLTTEATMLLVCATLEELTETEAAMLLDRKLLSIL